MEWAFSEHNLSSKKNILVLSMMLHDFVLNLGSLMRQKLQAADVGRICKLITVVTNFSCNDTTSHMNDTKQ